MDRTGRKLEQFGRLFDALTAKRGGEPEPLHETTAVLCYEVGKMLEQAMYMQRCNNSQLYEGRLAFYKSELIDALAQLFLICESLDISFFDHLEMGIEKAMDRFTGKEIKV